MEWILVLVMMPTLHCSALGCPDHVRQPIPTVELKLSGFKTSALCEAAAETWRKNGARESWPVRWEPQATCLRLK